MANEMYSNNLKIEQASSGHFSSVILFSILSKVKSKFVDFLIIREIHLAYPLKVFNFSS